MNITQATASATALRLQIDGHYAYVEEPKATLLDAGIVILLDIEGYWQDAIAEQFEIDGHPVALRGATRDAQVVALTRRFVVGAEGNLLED